MKSSLTVARVAGIPIRLHWSFFILVLLVVASAIGTTPADAAADAIWLAVLFLSVTLHELSHSMVGRRIGLEVKEILLLPIGGISRIEKLDRSPGTESLVAIAGPLASIVIGAVFLLAALATGAHLWPPSFYAGSWLTRIGWLNLALAAFNLLPALPMDGGRVLRSLLARGGNVLRATEISTVVAVVVASGMIAYGVERDYYLVLIGLFVIVGAYAEWQHARLRASLLTLHVAALMHHDTTTVPQDATAGDVARWLAHFPGRAVPVVDERGLYLGIADAAAAAMPPPGTPIGAVCDRDAPVLPPDASLFPAALHAFDSSHRGQLAVVQSGRVVGVLYRRPVAAAVYGAQQLSRTARL